eukprot:364537-Chlamydomonas_euryale.AAC.8
MLCGHAIRWHASSDNPSDIKVVFFVSCTRLKVNCHLMACNDESDEEGSSRKHKLPATGFARPYAAPRCTSASNPTSSHFYSN